MWYMTLFWLLLGKHCLIKSSYEIIKPFLYSFQIMIILWTFDEVLDCSLSLRMYLEYVEYVLILKKIIKWILLAACYVMNPNKMIKKVLETSFKGQEKQ